MLPAQRERLDALFLPRSAGRWRPGGSATSTTRSSARIARRLIWTFSGDGARAPASGPTARSSTSTDEPLDVTERQRRSQLWHPIGRPVDEVLAWRELARSARDPPAVQAGAPRGLPADRRRAADGDVLQPLRRPRPAAAPVQRALRRARLEEQAAADGGRRVPAGARASCRSGACGPSSGSRASATTTAPTRPRAARSCTWPPTRSASTASTPHRTSPTPAAAATPAAGGPRTRGVNEPLPLDADPAAGLQRDHARRRPVRRRRLRRQRPDWQDGGPGGRYRDYWQTLLASATSPNGPDAPRRCSSGWSRG